jgi:hypothetical protein
MVLFVSICGQAYLNLEIISKPCQFRLCDQRDGQFDAFCPEIETILYNRAQRA